MLLIPAVNGGINVLLRRLTSRIGEGVIYDLRVSLYSALQRMSLRFFTNTKVGELMSRLNNDVIGAQNAISNTIVGIITNLIQGVVILTVMLSLEWRLTLISVVDPAAVYLCHPPDGYPLAGYRPRSNGVQCPHERPDGRDAEYRRRFAGKTVRTQHPLKWTASASGREQCAALGSSGLSWAPFSLPLSVCSQRSVHRIVYGLGGYYVIKGQFTIGTIVALGAYLGTLYSALQGLANAPVEFATSMVSFERVFEVIDLPVDIPEKEDGYRVERYQRGDQL